MKKLLSFTLYVSFALLSAQNSKSSLLFAKRAATESTS
jgi:hypothetical protein